MRVMIDSVEPGVGVLTKKGVGKTSGKPYEMHHQVVYFDVGKRYPAEGKVRIEDPAKPYPVGEYVVDFGKSVYVDKYGALTLNEELVLEPLGQPAVMQDAKPAKGTAVA